MTDQTQKPADKPIVITTPDKAPKQYRQMAARYRPAPGPAATRPPRRSKVNEDDYLSGDNMYLDRRFLNAPSTRAQFRRSGAQVFVEPKNPVAQVEVVKRGQTYWDDPQRVARYYHAAQTLPPGAALPSWLDAAGVESAYKYFEQQNQGEPWYNWKSLADDDPGREYLATIPIPPPDAMIAPERTRFYPEYNTPSSSTPAENYYPVPYAQALSALGADVIAAWPRQGDNVLVPATYLDQYTQPQTTGTTPAPTAAYGGLPKEQFDALPGWQKAVITASPWLNTAIGGLMGAVGGAFIGGIPGAVIGGAVGAGGAKLAETNDAAMRLMTALGATGQWGEQAVGVLGQVFASISDPERYGTVQEVLGDLDSAWQAARLAADVSFSESRNDDGSYSVKYTPLGSTEEVEWRAPDGAIASSWALAQARKRINAGENPDAVVLDIQERFGFSAQVRDMLGQMFLDPQNLLGDVINAGGFRIAKTLGNNELAAAFKERSALATIPENWRRGLEGRKLIDVGSPFANDVVDALRLYGQKIRNLPVDEAVRYGAFSRWLAGIDSAGNTQVMRRGNMLDTMRGLTPQARAGEVLNQAIDGFQVLVRDELNPEVLVRKFAQIAAISPRAAVEAVEGLNTPRWFASVEAQPVVLAMRTQAEKVAELGDRWKITRPQAAILARVADVLGEDVYSLMARLHTGTSADATTTLRAFVQALQKRAAGDPANGIAIDRAAADLLRSITDGADTLTGETLKRYAGTFLGKNGAPFSAGEFQTQMLHMLVDGTERWAKEYFGVKPPHWAVRTGAMVKRAQGLVLLGINPTFLLNNAINNLVTLGWDGLLSTSTLKSGRDYLRKLQISPARLRAGANAAEIGDAGAVMAGFPVGETIRKATRAGDVIQQMDDFARKQDRFAIFANLSTQMERWSSEMATVTALRRFFESNWIEGRGLSKMDSDLAAVLDTVRPGLSRRVMRLIERHATKEAIEKAIFKDMGMPDVRDVMRAEERELFNQFPDLLDGLVERTRAAKTPQDVREAFSWVHDQFQERMDSQIRAGMGRIAEEARIRAQVEGGQAALDIYDNHMQQRAAFWLQHFERMEAAADEAATKTGYARQQVWRQANERADRDWKAFENIEGAKWLGLFEGMGAREGGEVYAGALRDLDHMHDVWSNFYQQRARLMDEFFARSEGADKDTARQLWLDTNEALNREYERAVLAEDDLQTSLDDLFIEQYANQFPDTELLQRQDEARNWRESVRNVRRRMAATQALYRNGGVMPDEIAQAWGDILPAALVQRIQNMTMLEPPYAKGREVREQLSKAFQQEIYVPYIREMLDASNGNAPGRRPQPANEPPPAPAPEPSPPAPAAAEPARAAEPPGATVTEGTTVQVPVMITRAMRQQLIDLGYTRNDIRGMTPQQAWDAINELSPRPAPAQTPPAAPAAEVQTPTTAPVDVRQQAADADFEALTRANEQAAELQRARLAGVFAVAGEYGIGGSTRADQIHVLNILKQRFRVDDIADVTPEMAREAFRERALWKGAVDKQAQAALDARINAYRAQVMRRNQQRMELASPKRFTRDAFYREAQEIVGEEQADNVAVVVDAIAEYWARENGRKVDDWYDMMLVTRGGEGENKGLTRWLDDGRALIHAYESADVSTLIHEHAHVWLPMMGERDIRIVQAWLKAQYDMDLPDGWQYGSAEHVQAKELFARAFERYLAEGRAPVPTMRRVFENFKNWMTRIYSKITGSQIDVKLDDDITRLFDRWMGGSEPEPARAPIAPPTPNLSPDAESALAYMRTRPRTEWFALNSPRTKNGKIQKELIDAGFAEVVDNDGKLSFRLTVAPVEPDDVSGWPKFERWQTENPQANRADYAQLVKRALLDEELGFDDAVELIGEAQAKAAMYDRLTQQAHTLTRQQFIDGARDYTSGTADGLSVAHRALVETALTEGKSVPDEVLRDYPDLYLSKVDDPEPQTIYDGTLMEAPAGQGSLFGEEQAGFGLIAQRARDEVFQPEQQPDSLFGLRDYTEAPQMRGAVEGGDAGELPLVRQAEEAAPDTTPVQAEVPPANIPANMADNVADETPAAVEVAPIEPTPAQLHETAGRFVEDAPSPLLPLFRQGYEKDSGMGATWNPYWRAAESAWSYLRDIPDDDPNANHTIDRRGYSFEGGSLMLRPPQKKGGKWAASYSPSTEKVASQIEPPRVDVTPVVEPAHVVDAPAVQVTTLDDFDGLRQRFNAGEVTAEEWRQAFQSFIENRETIRQELSRLPVAQLQKMTGRRGTKTELVNSRMFAMEDSFAFNGYTYSMFGGNRDVSLGDAVSKLTDADIQTYTANRREQRAALRKAVTNPETLDEYETFIAYRGEKSFTPEQRAQYDELIALRNKANRAKAAQPPARTIQPAGTKVQATIKETTKRKDGTPIFVVQMAERVEREVYNDLNAKAKQLGGYYSSFVKADAGFTFSNREAAERFMKLLDGEEAAPITARPIEEPNAPVIEAQPTVNKAAERMRATADRMEAAANEKLNADRLTNTARRARMAAGAESDARANIALARTMRNLADAIESGDATHLDNVTSRTHVELLDNLLRNARGEHERAAGTRYREWDGKPLDAADVEYAKYPYPFVQNGIIRDAAQALKGKRGYTRALETLQRAVGERDWAYLTSTQEIEALQKVIDGAGAAAKYWNTGMDDYKRAQAMNLKSVEELRAALREYLQFRKGAAKADPIKELERGLIGRNIPGYFPTPKDTVRRMLAEAEIEPGMRVLEPSAGKGNIADVIRESTPEAELDVLEYDNSLSSILREKGHNVVGYDFLQHSGAYDRIVMNPPFENGQDIQHVERAFELLKPGGRLVSIMGEGAFYRSDKQALAFRDWLENMGGWSEKLPEGTFLSSERPTGVNTRLVVINKSANPIRFEDAFRAGVRDYLLNNPETGRNYVVAAIPEIDIPDYGKMSIEDAVQRAGNIENVRSIINDAWKQAEMERAIGSTETPRLTGEEPPQALFQNTNPGETYAYGADGTRYQMRYKVVDLDDLTQSHLDTFDPNPRYPAEIQPRARDRKAYREQVREIASKLDERALLETHKIEDGTPIVGGDNVVESGNGRTIAFRLARRDYPESWQNYQTMLREKLAEFGLSESDLEGITNPVLVRERITDVDRVQFAQAANTPASSRMDAMERAFADQGQIDPRQIAQLQVSESQTIEGALRRRDNAPIVDAWLQKLPQSERTELIGNDGSLNAAGLQRLKYALFAYVYPGEAGRRITDAFVNSANPGMKNIEAALYDTLGIMSQAESLIKAGQRAEEYSIAGDVIKAVDMLARLKAQGMSAGEYAQQINMLDAELSPFQTQLMVYLDTNAKRGRAKVRDLLALYADNVINVQQDPGQGALFAGASATKGEILDAVAQQIGAETDFASAAPEAAAAYVAPPAPPEPEPPAPAAPQSEPPAEMPVAAANSPLGTAEEFREPPQEEAMLETWMRQFAPMLERMEQAMLDPANRQQQALDLGAELDAEGMKKLKRFIARVVDQDLPDTKLGAIRYGESRRDQALLNYTRKTNLDSWAQIVFPYQFWYTRSMLNWAVRAIDRPTILANYQRLRNLQDKYNEYQEGTERPYRLRKKIGVNAPFLPAWMGGKIYTDPLKQLFPFDQMARPFEKWGEQKNMEQKKLESVLQEMVESEEITEAQMQEALQAKAGSLYERALASARNQLDQEIENPLDFAQMMSGFNLPLSIGYNLAMGRKEKISQLPVTRFIQANTAALGIGGPRGVNIEAPLRRALDLPEMGGYEDYNVDRMLANLAAEGVITADDAKRAMMDRQGPAFTLAQQRVSQMGGFQYWGAPLGVDFIPEGERETRALRAVYDQAREKWAAGDKDALNKFYDEHPEYEARQMSWNDDPEQRLRGYLKAEVWQRYMELPSLHKEQAAEQFGRNFQDLFLNRDTRNYDAINTETLALWAKLLGANNPESAPDVASLPLQLAPPEIARTVQDYKDQLKQRYPNIGAVINTSMNLTGIEKARFDQMHPEVDEYYQWKNSFLAAHPEVTTYITSEQSELYGQPQDVQAHVYNYRAQRDQYFPGIDRTQSAYFLIEDKKQRKAYLKAHPELGEYWTWRKEMAAAYTKAAPYILSDQSLQKAILGDENAPKLTNAQIAQLSPATLRALAAAIYTGESLRPGAISELDALWQSMGEPGEFWQWVDEDVKGTLQAGWLSSDG